MQLLGQSQRFQDFYESPLHPNGIHLL